MKVKVTWRNNNPFADLEHMAKSSEAELLDDMDYGKITEFAREATPEGFHLRSIDISGKVTQYDYHGNEMK